MQKDKVDTIDYYLGKIKPYFGLIFITLLAFLCFGLWQLHALASTKTPLKIVNLGIDGQGQATDEPQDVVASKTGTKYYLPWCGALSRIKPENRVTFASAELARQAGYTPAANCKGVK